MRSRLTLSRCALVALAPGLALALTLGCNRGSTSAAQANTLEQPSADFIAPDAEGWGRAAGLRYLEVDVARGQYAGNPRLPMVVLIHGLGDRPHREWAQDLGAGLPVRMILPEAPSPWHGGFSWFEYRWPNAEPRALAKGLHAAAARLAPMLATLQAKRPTLGRPIVAGFSQGGMLSFALALEHPELVASAFPISGSLPEPLWPIARPRRGAFTKIRALHGTADSVVPFAADERLVARLRTLGYDASLTAYEGVEHTITRAMAEHVNEEIGLAVRALHETEPSGVWPRVKAFFGSE